MGKKKCEKAISQSNQDLFLKQNKYPIIKILKDQVDLWNLVWNGQYPIYVAYPLTHLLQQPITTHGWQYRQSPAWQDNF